MKIGKEERNKTQETQAIAQNNCSPPTDPNPPLSSNRPLPVHELSRVFCGMEYPFDQLGSAVLAMLCHSFLWTFSLAEYGTSKSL